MSDVKKNDRATSPASQDDPKKDLNESELADYVAKEIIIEIERNVDHYLSKYHKYTLNAPTIAASESESTAQFFRLISILKDVSILGRKLLEAAPQLTAQRCDSPISKTGSSSISETDSIKSKSEHKRLGPRDDDVTSEDLLAALIESSSSDDFLVLSSSLESVTLRDMIMASLLYIKSHECFTLSHDIQGVAMVLRRTKFLIINILTPKNQMELVIKLLTSIARYNEMNYVFDLFRDRNQFEILLSKGVEKTPELRIALYNYVKKHPEFYALVTLNFSMFREIAESLEANAMGRLDKVLSDKAGDEVSSMKQSVDANEESTMIKRLNRSRDTLNVCLYELVDAAVCYEKAGCYKRSEQCEKKAKLVSLQQRLLDTGGTCVLKLSQASLNDVLVNLQSFTHAHIVAQAYDYHLAWRQALFNNVILKGNIAYLHEFCRKCDLSSVLVEELVMLYKQHLTSNQSSSKMEDSMKKLLAKLCDVELKCKIYSQLNFDDAKLELLQDPAIEAHLKDLKLA